MSVHLLHSTIQQCYCNNDVSKEIWASVFHGEFHYKEAKCSSCGKQLCVKVDFDGSGHDEWEGRTGTLLDDLIEKHS